MAIAMSLSFGPLRIYLEQSMFIQMVIQIPILFIGGALLSETKILAKLFGYLNKINLYGLTSFMLAQIILVYWMLPISIDRAVVTPWMDLTKIVSMIIAGLCVGQALQKAPLAIQLFFIGYFTAMMIWLGFYFATSDIRLCNVYSLNSQHLTGYGLVAISAIILSWWSWRILKDRSLF
jgi:hypothetical protein